MRVLTLIRFISISRPSNSADRIKSFVDKLDCNYCHSSYPPPPPPISCQVHPLNRQTFQDPLFRQSPPLNWFFVNPPIFPLKVGFFSGPPKYQSSSYLIPSYLLKVTKFLGNISQFELLVMAEKNILSLNISDFNLFFM